MTTIYIRHANGQIMEVQNWDTLTDYGAMVTRPLSASEQERYLALKSIRFKDSDIWKVLHPRVLSSPTSSSPASITSVEISKPERTESDRPQPYIPKNRVPRTCQPQTCQSSEGRESFSSHNTARSKHSSRPHCQNSHAQRETALDIDTTPDIEISTRELSKNALLHIIQKACGRDIEVLKGASRDDLLSLASGILPPAGVSVKVMPRLGTPSV